MTKPKPKPVPGGTVRPRADHPTAAPAPKASAARKRPSRAKSAVKSKNTGFVDPAVVAAVKAGHLEATVSDYDGISYHPDNDAANR